MAWNEPGGNNNDPWKNKGGRDQGPPDIDEIFKKFFAKLGGGKNGSGDGMGLGWKSVAIILGILLTIWVISGFYTIREAERGVQLTFGKFSEFKDPGLRWKKTFIDKVYTVDVKSIRHMSSSGFMLTQDENVVRVEMEIQYKVVQPYKFTFSVNDPVESLRQALDSAIRYVVGHSNMNDVLTSGREVARQQVWEELQKIIEPYGIGIDVVDVNFKDARPPDEVKAAFDDAIAAQEDEVRTVREAEAYARAIEPQARGQVKRMSQEADAYKQRVILEAKGEVARFNELLPQYEAAPEVTRQRLYLETMEYVYSHTSKVLVDSKGSGNMLYLPLDKILERQNGDNSPANQKDSIENLRRTSQSNTQSPASANRSDNIRTGRNQ